MGLNGRAIAKLAIILVTLNYLSYCIAQIYQNPVESTKQQRVLTVEKAVRTTVVLKLQKLR